MRMKTSNSSFIGRAIAEGVVLEELLRGHLTAMSPADRAATRARLAESTRAAVTDFVRESPPHLSHLAAEAQAEAMRVVGELCDAGGA